MLFLKRHSYKRLPNNFSLKFLYVELMDHRMFDVLRFLLNFVKLLAGNVLILLACGICGQMGIMAGWA